MGIEERESYDPVDLAIDIYQTTAGEDPIMTLADYARDSRMRLTEVEKYYNGAVYIKKFLEFIGAPATSYEIIKESKSWSLFYEMGKVLKKELDRKSTRLNSNHVSISYAVFCLKKKNETH